MMKATNVETDRSPVEAPSMMEPADSELLMQFIRHRREDAFAVIVQRHGPMVLGVCMQILGNRHDAEDAFQATFLVLAGRAAKIQKLSSVGAWLHQVAYRTSMRAAKQRQRRERLLGSFEPLADDPFAQIAQQEQQTALYEELNRLPRRYRAPLVLCYLEGKRQQEAADALDCSVHAIQASMTRGKRMLRMRLARRGVMMSAAFTVAAAGVSSSQSASISALFSSTSQACAVAAGEQTQAFSTSVTSLAHQGKPVMNMVTFARMGIAATLLFGLSMVWFASQGIAGRPSEAGQNSAPVLQVASVQDGQAVDISEQIDIAQALIEFVSQPDETDEPQEPARDPKDKAVLPMAGAGLIGRAKTEGGDAGIVFIYTHGKVLNPEPVRSRIDGDFVLTLRGELQVPRDMVVQVRHAGGGVSHDVNTLFVDEKKISSVGDDRSKQASNELTLKKGAHAVRWELTGGTFRNNLLKFFDAETGEMLPLEFGLKGLPDEPVKEVVRVGVDKRGWPIPEGW